MLLIMTPSEVETREGKNGLGRGSLTQLFDLVPRKGGIRNVRTANR